MTIFNFLKNIISPKKVPVEKTEKSAGVLPLPIDPSTVENILKMLAATESTELGCDEVFELLDQFAEMASRGENVTDLLPKVKQHLDQCGDCREEYEALIRILEN